MKKKLFALLLCLFMVLGCATKTSSSIRLPQPPPVVTALPVVTMTASPSSGQAPLTVAFFATCSTCVAYAWDFGDGSTNPAPGPTQVHTYQTPGDYDAVVAATDSKGQPAHADQIVSVTGIDPNGPPTYTWAYAGTAAIPTPATAPFMASDPAGTIKSDSTLSKNAHIVRLTDAVTGCKYFVATPSGGANDIISNTNETLWTARCEGANWVVAVNPKTLQVLSHSAKPVAGGSTAFSQVKDNVLYVKPAANSKIGNMVANGTTIYSVIFPYSSTLQCGFTTCPDPNGTLVYTPVVDFAQKCAQVPSGAPKWQSILGVGDQDFIFTSSFSWTGTQNTGHLQYAYTTDGNCQTLDTAGNGTNPFWYASKAATGVPAINGFTNQPLQCTFATIHDSGTNGQYVEVSHEKTNGGPDCGSNEGPFIWLSGTSKIYNLAIVKNASGHASMSTTFYYSEPFPTAAHPFSNLATSYTIGFPVAPGCKTCGAGVHYQADRVTGQNPVVGTTGGEGGEVYAIPVTLPAADPKRGNPTMRFVKTYSSGATGNNFDAQWSIGAPGQARKMACWTSDMLGQLGTYVDAGVTYKRSDIFCVGLAAQ